MAVIHAKFTRVLTPQSAPGPDIEGVGRALIRAGHSTIGIRAFEALPKRYRQAWGPRKQHWCQHLEGQHERRQNGNYEEPNHEDLVAEGGFDPKAANLMLQYRPPAAICYPIPLGWSSSVCQAWHETAGVPGNWAYDFCVPEIVGNGAPVLAVEDAEVIRLSGHAPSQDDWDAAGVFGWTIYLQTHVGYVYFVTHLGDRVANTLGQRVRCGEVIGHIGDQHYRPDHVHVGVTSPFGEKDARAHIAKVAQSPRVKALT